MQQYFARRTLLLGNFAVGLSVLAPASAMPDIASSFSISISQASLLMSCGAIAICIGAPVMARLTTSIDRRTLLTIALGTIAAGNLLSALVSSFALLLIIRVVMMLAAAIYTPQAANMISQITDEKTRSSAIAYVFLGWPLAFAVGLPAFMLLATCVGWQNAYACLSVAVIVIACLVSTLARGRLKARPASLKMWRSVLQSRLIMQILLVTLLCNASQFIVFPYLGTLLADTTGALPAAVSAIFSAYGFAGLLGNILAIRLVRSISTLSACVTYLLIMMIGALIWIAGLWRVEVLAAGIICWGLGFAASNSLQQARLVQAAPDLAIASVSLNTSAIYLGQAFGTVFGGYLYAMQISRGFGFAVGVLLGLAFVMTLFGGRHLQEGRSLFAAPACIRRDRRRALCAQQAEPSRLGQRAPRATPGACCD